MGNYFKPLTTNLSHEEDGQIAVLMIMILPVVFLFFALALDAGIWFFDHRLAQNQVDASVLAAMRYLPAKAGSVDYLQAEAAVDLWLEKNGSGPEELCDPDGSGSYSPTRLVSDGSGSFPQFYDLHPTIPDGRADAIRVCVRRESPGIFSNLANVEFIYVSAAATARVGPVGIANVKPWAIAPEDPTCNLSIENGGRICQADMDGDSIPEDCGFYPPIPVGHPQADLGLCPWGLHEWKLQRFKVSGTYTPGNFAPIKACGGSGADDYKKCIIGDTASGFFEVGQKVMIEIQTGNMVGPTISGVGDLYNYEELLIPGLDVDGGGQPEDTLWCDVLATPDPITGFDRDGLERAMATMVEGNYVNQIGAATNGVTEYDYIPSRGCNRRLISIAIIDHFPTGGGEALVLGVGTFGIARWDRTPQFGDALGNADLGQICGQGVGPPAGVGGFECGQVWGYFMKEAKPPEVLLNIIETDNPFAPLLVALVE